jgi:phosphoadenosine phosphosulfate reductase
MATPSESLSSEELGRVAAQLGGAPAEEILAWADARFGERAAIASSFGVEDVVLIDLAARHAPRLRVFTLDTGRLNPETYEILEVVRKRYGLDLEVYAPQREATEKLVREKGAFSFRQGLDERHECCRIRKLEPLERALSGRAAWVTGLRREQSPTRGGIRAVEVDAAHGGITKVNPLAAWTEAQTWAYVAERGLPYNALHDRGYRSIGCAPCTRAIRPFEDVRAGRWWWEHPEHKECGLHSRGAG